MDTERTFKDLARENTGRHLLDSGDAYGRHWQQPPIPDGAPLVSWDEYGPTLHTGPYLDECMEIDTALQTQFEEFCEGREGGWFDNLRAFADAKGWLSCARDNTYNSEQDLDQQFIFEVFRTDGEDDNGDWFFLDDSESIVAISIHTGCDVRGGYSRPVLCHAPHGSEYVLPIDWVVGFEPVEARAPVGPGEYMEISPWKVPDAERWSVGYSSWPTGQLEDSVARTFEFTRNEEDGTVCVLLASGYLCKVQAIAPYCY